MVIKDESQKYYTADKAKHFFSNVKLSGYIKAAYDKNSSMRCDVKLKRAQSLFFHTVQFLKMSHLYEEQETLSLWNTCLWVGK